MSRLIRSTGIYVALLLVATLSIAAVPVQRVVVIGDIHGDLNDFEVILQKTGLMSATGQWAGGDAVLIQEGDILDRGPKSRGCLDLLMALERQAPRQKGKVIVLLGNHELMAMTGDFRYVSAEDYQSFSSAKSEDVREQAYQDYLKFLSARSDALLASRDAQEARGQWMMQHPAGFFERRDAFGPHGTYGKWLRQHDSVFQLENVAFMHGGLNPTAPFRDVSEINHQIHTELATFDAIWNLLSSKNVIWKYMTMEEAISRTLSEWSAIQQGLKVDPELKQDVQAFLRFPKWLINSPDGPLWNRELAEQAENELEASDVDMMLARLGLSIIVAAHTPQPDGRINARFGNHIFLIDTGMLHSVFGGRASALELRDGTLRAYYADGEPETLSAPAAISPPQLSKGIPASNGSGR